VTTQPNEQQEPSMEEILSSIRRIIADEATDEDGGGAEDEDERPVNGTPGMAADRAPDALVLAEPGRDDDGDGDGDADDDQDVLELTDVVRESGEVIALDLASPSAAPSEPGALEPDPPGQEHDAADQAAAEDDQDTAPHKASEDDPAEGEPDAPPSWSRAASSDDAPSPSPIAEIRDYDMANHETATETPQNGIDGLVSAQAAGAATGAFAKLSQAVQRTPPELAIADDSGRTTEQFVEDMMRPMLRDWLDQNLPSMVERIVQKEIQKMIRRAED
jgi:cell pole-organizing protein PopZ